MSYTNKGERNNERGRRCRAQDGRSPGKWHFIKQWKREEIGQMISSRAPGQACLILSPQIRYPTALLGDSAVTIRWLSRLEAFTAVTLTWESGES